MKMKLLAILALLLFFIIPGCGDDSGVTVNSAVPPVGASTVQGTVYGTDGQPVGDGITVRLAPNMATVTASENYGEQQTAITDAQGWFSFTVHYTGTYFIDALEGTQLLGGQFFNVTGAGQVINILLGKPTGKLTVNVVPPDANTAVTVEPGGDLTTSASTVTGSQTGEYIFYLTPGLYTVDVTATGYESVETQSVNIEEGGEYTLTFDFTVDGETQLLALIDPYACINTGEVPVKYYVRNFTGTGTIDFILKSTGEVIHTLSVTESDLVEEDVFPYLACTINTTTMPAGLYNVKLTHNPPVISESSTIVEQDFYISETIQGAIDEASSGGSYFSQEIITPWGEKTVYYKKAYIPAGNYYYAGPGDFHKALPSPNIINRAYLQGAGRDTTILDLRGNSSVGPGFIEHYGAIEGFTIKGCAGGGIYPRYGNSYIFNNRIENNFQGIVNNTTYARNFYVFDNIINNNTAYGISLTGSPGVTCINIGNNIIFENGCGINLRLWGDFNFITGNNIYKNTGGGIYIITGDYLYDVDIANNVIWENSTTANGGGIYVNNAGIGSPVHIRNNEIRENTASNYSVGVSGYGGGIYYDGNTTYGTITGNNIYGNTTSANPNTGRQLFCTNIPALNADNNWWNVAVDDDEVYKVTAPATVDIGTPATTQFPVADVPSMSESRMATD